MRRQGILLVFAAVTLVFLIGGQASAQPVEYVRVCDMYGTAYYYIPGTEQCLNPDTGEIRYETEDGTVFTQSQIARRLAEAEDALEELENGVAMSNALANPDLIGGEHFGFALNWGQYEGSHAFGLSATGVLADDLFNGSTRMAVSGALAVGESGGFGSRAGLQLSW